MLRFIELTNILKLLRFPKNYFSTNGADCLPGRTIWLYVYVNNPCSTWNPPRGQYTFSRMTAIVVNLLKGAAKIKLHIVLS